MALPHVLFTTVSVSTTAASKTVVAAASGFRYHCMGMQLLPASANTVTIQTSTGGVLYGPYNSTGAKPLVLPPTEIGYFETAASKSVKVQLNNAAVCIVNMQYQIVHAT